MLLLLDFSIFLGYGMLSGINEVPRGMLLEGQSSSVLLYPAGAVSFGYSQYAHPGENIS